MLSFSGTIFSAHLGFGLISVIFDSQVGALQDVKSELTKLRGILFYKVVEDLHAHLYNKGDYRYYHVGLHTIFLFGSAIELLKL